VINRTRVFLERSKSGAVFHTRSINPFEGGRWRLQRMRARVRFCYIQIALLDRMNPTIAELTAAAEQEANLIACHF
jgi:hypothetical protein